MLRKTMLILLLVIISVTASAYDQNAFENSLKNYSEAISQTAYLITDTAQNNNKEALNAAIDRADKAESSINALICKFETQEEITQAQQQLEEFATVSELNAHTVALVEKFLLERITFLALNNEIEQNLNFNVSGKAVAPQALLNARQKRMITFKVPIVEATLSFDDTKNARRLENFKNILQRHNCKILANHTEKNKDFTHNYYFSGRKYVVDAILGHFGGDIVESNLKSVLKITTGGFWSGKKSLEFKINPDVRNGVMGDLSWYKSVVEHDPTKYLVEHNYNELVSLGSIETVVGNKKLHLKNLVAELWIMSKNANQNNAIYYSKAELGDLFVDAF